MSDRLVIKKVLGDRILVEPLPSPAVSSGGIHLSDGMAMDRLIKARVVQIGTRVKEQLVPGDIVLFEDTYGMQTDRTEKQRLVSVGCIKAKVA